ncbi:hypothetical protein ABZ912_14250 [Nonomuraea angiospora]|uniref:hypothetical protein n=1 Tax=Nonomuraea angiospora TaxID=46172 RepID=UPI0033D7B8DA
MHLSPLAKRLLDLITGTANDPTRWPDASQLNVGLTGVAGSAPGRYAIDERARQQLAAPARELVGFLMPEDRTWSYGRFPMLVAAGLAGMDAEVSARARREMRAVPDAAGLVAVLRQLAGGQP